MNSLELYKNLHSQFLNNIEREYIQNPETFSCDGKTFSTNNRIILRTPEINGFKPPSDDIKNYLPKLFFRTNTLPINIEVEKLKEALSKIEMQDCYDETTKECDACYGTGEVEYEFSYETKTFEIERECPICDGEGKIYIKSDTPNGKKEYKKNKYIQLGKVVYCPDTVEELINIAQLTNQSKIQIIHQDSDKSTLFQIDVNVEIVAMPLHSWKCDDTNIVAKIGDINFD